MPLVKAEMQRKPYRRNHHSISNSSIQGSDDERGCGSLFHIHDWCVRQVSVYQRITSPVLPPACRFIPMFPVHDSAPICRLDHYEWMDRLDQHNMIASDVV